MAGFLSGLSKFGLGNMKDQKLYEDPKKKEGKTPQAAAPAKPLPKNEVDFLFDKKYTCPICEKSFISKTVRTGKVKMKAVDLDLRPDYDEVDQIKYDVVACPECGYAALAKYFDGLIKYQKDEIRAQIAVNYMKQQPYGETYSYEVAKGRYELALANAMVKKAKNSEKAYLCLKTAWLIRGWYEHMDPAEENFEKRKEELVAEEKDLLSSAKEGFVMARQSEGFPIAGMDEGTLDYLIAALAYETEDYDVASKMAATIVASRTASSRLKDKARDLKDMISEKTKSEE
ncbi:MAG: DUF2225 domain-containing protein [Butyrivibrio sp.]|nr:DUF2225 domain-containing protein [Butyrivibrio sp.]